jgi:HEAT repeat protein
MHFQAQEHIYPEGQASMDSTEILWLLEKPTRDRRRFLRQIRDEAAVADIVAALRTSANPRTRAMLCYILQLRAGAESFEGRSSETKQAVPALLEALADPDRDVRREAIDAFGYIGDPAAGPALFEVYQKEPDDSSLRVLLASVLGFCQYAPATPTLIEALSSPDDLLRRQATWGLRHLQAQEAKEPLRKALAQETDALTRQTMQETLQELEHPTTREEECERLIAQLTNAKTAHERGEAAVALGDMGECALPSLLSLLHHRQGEVRYYAIQAISALSEHRDADWFVRRYREQVQGPLIEALADQESYVRAAAAGALGTWRDERAVDPLLAAMQDTDVKVRRAAVDALDYPKDERALEPLLSAFFNDNDMEVRDLAARALGRHTEDNRTVNALIQALQNKQSDKRKQAAGLLCSLKDERAVDALLQALQDTVPAVREWSIKALWALCVDKGDDLPDETVEKMRIPIMRALQDSDHEVRECAEKIIAWLY